jgi:hypothetical protein
MARVLWRWAACYPIPKAQMRHAFFAAAPIDLAALARHPRHLCPGEG